MRNFRRAILMAISTGRVTLRTALQASYNIPVFRVYAFIGNEAFVRFSERLGMQFLPGNEFNLTSAVGSNEVRMWDMNEAFGVFAGGWGLAVFACDCAHHRPPRARGGAPRARG